MVGMLAVLPWIMYQLWAFVAPGLYTHEKKFALPLIIFGSAMLLKVMERFPIIITLGAGLLGLLAGGMLVDDPAIKDSIQAALGDAKLAFEVIGIAIVILVGTYLKKKNAAKAH